MGTASSSAVAPPGLAAGALERADNRRKLGGGDDARRKGDRASGIGGNPARKGLEEGTADHPGFTIGALRIPRRFGNGSLHWNNSFWFFDRDQISAARDPKPEWRFCF
jgi:hypothetical protein